MKRKLLTFNTLILVAIAGVVAWATIPPNSQPNALNRKESLTQGHTDVSELAAPIQQVDNFFDARWQEFGFETAEEVDELLILRRLSLALHGTIPSLEEIRNFESDTSPNRLSRWIHQMLNDNRFGDYFAERLARSYVGVEGGPFIIFRRDRFTDWLSDQLQSNTPYNEIVRQLITGEGLWTEKPETNFITVAIANNELDENKLAARSVRAFLGQRIDCAQCHDHPFDHWKQEEFEGLAAHFGQASISPFGISDKQDQEYEIEDRKTLETITIDPAVPFHPEWIPETGSQREKFAIWITHPENRRFERAIANRVWALLFGKAWHAPVDDLPDPESLESTDLLDILGSDFREHGYDLRRLIKIIVSSKPFRLSSQHAEEDAGRLAAIKDEWGVYPLVRLRPEQVIGSMLQASSIKTIDQNSHLITRTMKFFRENNFIQEYGDLGDNEFEEQTGTIPQALLRMNGELAKDVGKTNPVNASGRISGFSSTAEKCLENCYLVCYSRRPTPEEQAHFLPQLQEASKKRGEIVEDIFWTLFNSPEFSWNH